MANFAELGLGEPLQSALQSLGIESPTPVQEKLLPEALAGHDLLAVAPTGTGKTLAYLLPLLQQIKAEERTLQAVVLAPTYELAMQIAAVARDMSQRAGLGIRVQGIIGGANIARQITKLKEKPQLVVGSAGRINELVRKNKLRLPAVRYVVFDEFDRLLGDELGADTAAFVRLLPDRAACQYLLVSATAPHKAVERAESLGELTRIEIKDEESRLPENLRHYYVVTDFRDKIGRVRRLARRLHIRRGLVFINRLYDAEKTLAHLRYDGLNVDTLLGSQGKQDRQSALAAFRAGRTMLLLSTDLAARGLDIAGIDYVINLDLPDDAAQYQHRAGRTARAGADGAVITLVAPPEQKKLAGIAQSLGIMIKKLPREASADDSQQKAPESKAARAAKKAQRAAKSQRTHVAAQARKTKAASRHRNQGFQGLHAHSRKKQAPAKPAGKTDKQRH